MSSSWLDTPDSRQDSFNLDSEWQIPSSTSADAPGFLDSRNALVNHFDLYAPLLQECQPSTSEAITTQNPHHMSHHPSASGSPLVPFTPRPPAIRRPRPKGHPAPITIPTDYSTGESVPATPAALPGTPSTVTFQLPAMEACRPAARGRSPSIVLSEGPRRRANTNAARPRKRLRLNSGEGLSVDQSRGDEGESQKSVRDLIDEYRRDFTALTNSVPSAEEATSGDLGLAQMAQGEHLLTALKLMHEQMLTLAEKLADLAPSAGLKVSKKLAKTNRTQADEEIYTLFKVCA